MVGGRKSRGITLKTLVLYEKRRRRCGVRGVSACAKCTREYVNDSETESRTDRGNGGFVTKAVWFN